MAWVEAWIFVLLMGAASSCSKTREEEEEAMPSDGVNDAGMTVEYTAAVLEYEPYNNWVSGGLAILQENTRIYLEYAALAKEQGADIMVFPEYGLTGLNLAGDFLSLTQVLPDPADLIVPCDLPGVSNYTLVVRELSCAAAQLGMYMVVDLAEQEPCTDAPPSSSTKARPSNGPSEPDTQVQRPDEGGCPSSGYNFYNSQVVFDRSGTAVARYRKKHLFLEPEFTPGNDDDASAIFTTDFGVTFTLQVCFDIAYESPGFNNVVQRGVKDVAMSSAWINELPFLTAPQIFDGWSAGLAANLLVANYHNSTVGGLGSGIFRGFAWEAPDYTYDPDGGTTLLVGSVTTPSSDRAEEGGCGCGGGCGGVVEEGRPNYHRRLDSEGGRSPGALSVDFSGHPEREVERERSRTNEGYVFIHEDLSNYSYAVLNSSEKDIIFIKGACHNDSLCCTAVYTYPFNETEEGLYMILAYSGVVQKGGGAYGIFTQVCAIVFCLNDDISSCARVEGQDPHPSSFRAYNLNGSFTTPYVYPSVFTQDMTLINETAWSFHYSRSTEDRSLQISLNENVPNLLSLTMFGRWYERDPDFQ